VVGNFEFNNINESNNKLVMFQIDAQVVLKMYLVFGFHIAIWPQD
jgi:hypothetical protein